LDNDAEVNTCNESKTPQSRHMTTSAQPAPPTVTRQPSPLETRRIAFDLIKVLVVAKAGQLTSDEIGDKLGVPRSTIHRWVAILTSLGYVEKLRAMGPWWREVMITGKAAKLIDSLAEMLKA
jgi:hypothetical protein